MSQHKMSYVISYHGILCHNILYVMAMVTSLILTVYESNVAKITFFPQCSIATEVEVDSGLLPAATGDYCHLHMHACTLLYLTSHGEWYKVQLLC